MKIFQRSKKNELNVIVVQDGVALSGAPQKKLEIILNTVMLYIFQFFPIIVFLIIDMFTAASYNISDYAENILVICIVSNATSVFNNTKKTNMSNSIVGKLFSFLRSMIMSLGSIVYSILLINRISTIKLQIVTNINGIMIFAGACLVVTIAISFLSVLNGGEV